MAASVQIEDGRTCDIGGNLIPADVTSSEALTLGDAR